MSEQTQQRPQLPTGFYIACPHCAKELRIHGKYLGARTACKFCDGQFQFELANQDLKIVAVYTPCPHCAHELRAASSFLGRVVACKRCDKPFQLSTVGLRPTASDERKTTDKSDIEPTDQWYCQVVGQTMGPMNLAALGELVQSGQLAGDDPVRCGKTGEWQIAKRVASLTADVGPQESADSHESHGNVAPPSAPQPSQTDQSPEPAAAELVSDIEDDLQDDGEATFTASDDDFF